MEEQFQAEMESARKVCELNGQILLERSLNASLESQLSRVEQELKSLNERFSCVADCQAENRRLQFQLELGDKEKSSTVLELDLHRKMSEEVSAIAVHNNV